MLAGALAGILVGSWVAALLYVILLELVLGLVQCLRPLAWTARQPAHDQLAVGVHYVQVPLHKPQHVPRIRCVMTVCGQLAYELGLLSDLRLALRDMPIGSREVLVQG